MNNPTVVRSNNWQRFSLFTCKPLDDGADEPSDCINVTCPNGYFQCRGSGKCIPMDKVCDSVDDCSSRDRANGTAMDETVDACRRNISSLPIQMWSFYLSRCSLELSEQFKQNDGQNVSRANNLRIGWSLPLWKQWILYQSDLCLRVGVRSKSLEKISRRSFVVATPIALTRQTKCIAKTIIRRTFSPCRCTKITRACMAIDVLNSDRHWQINYRCVFPWLNCAMECVNVRWVMMNIHCVAVSAERERRPRRISEVRWWSTTSSH